MAAPAQRVLLLPDDVGFEAGAALGLNYMTALFAFALACGAHEAVLADGWLVAVNALEGERAVDIVFDPVGGDRVTDSIRSLAPDGRLLVLGFASGEIPTVKVNRLLLGNRGVLGAASLEYFEQRPSAIVDLWARLLGLRHAGELPNPPVQQFSFADAERAPRDRGSRSQGKGGAEQAGDFILGASPLNMFSRKVR